MTDFSQLVLPTARLVLRPLVPADAPAVYAMHADPVTLRYVAQMLESVGLVLPLYQRSFLPVGTGTVGLAVT